MNKEYLIISLLVSLIATGSITWFAILPALTSYSYQEWGTLQLYALLLSPVLFFIVSGVAVLVGLKWTKR